MDRLSSPRSCPCSRSCRRRRRAQGKTPAPGDHRLNGARERQLRAAANAVGRSGPAGHVDERRHARHPDASGRSSSATALYSTTRSSPTRSKRDEDGAASAPRTPSGSFRNDVGTRTFRQTSLIVDPARRPHPAFTPDAETRRARATAAPSATARSTRLEDFTLYDRCITRGIVGGVHAGASTATATASCRRPAWSIISYEMVHDTRVIYTDGRAARRHRHPPVPRRLARPLGGQHAGDRDHQLHRQDQHRPGNGNGLRHSADMKITERITRVDKDDRPATKCTVDDPKTYVAAVHDLAAADAAARRRAAALRVPRGQLRAAALAQRRARRRQGDRRRPGQRHHAAAACGSGQRARTVPRRRRSRGTEKASGLRAPGFGRGRRGSTSMKRRRLDHRSRRRAPGSSRSAVHGLDAEAGGAAARHHRLQRRRADSLHGAADAVGRSGSPGRVEQRRHRRHPARAAARARHAALSDRRGVGGAAEAGARRRQARRERRSARSATTSPRRAFRQTSLIVDPPDGRHAGGHARGREAPRAARPRHVRRRPVQHLRGLHALRPLHHARHRRLGAARRLRQRQPHRAGAGHGGLQLRDDPRHAHHLHRRPAAPRAEASGSTSATRAHAGKATSWSSRRRTSPTRPASAATATACATATRW